MEKKSTEELLDLRPSQASKISRSIEIGGKFFRSFMAPALFVWKLQIDHWIITESLPSKLRACFGYLRCRTRKTLVIFKRKFKKNEAGFSFCFLSPSALSTRVSVLTWALSNNKQRVYDASFLSLRAPRKILVQFFQITLFKTSQLAKLFWISNFW